jgi:hypothetical protein
MGGGAELDALRHELEDLGAPTTELPPPSPSSPPSSAAAPPPG